MDMRAGDEVPSFTVKSAKPLSSLVSVTRLKMQLDVTSETGLRELAQLVEPLHGGKSELVIKTRIEMVVGRILCSGGVFSWMHPARQSEGY